MGTYARRSPLRFLAPIALVIFAIALLMILSSSGGSDSGGSTSASDQQKNADLGTSSKKTKRKRTSANGSLPTRTYTVKSGDTLGSISAKTGIPVGKLQEINPQLDPQQLVSGQKIKLRE
jgi:LysM repeat protein